MFEYGSVWPCIISLWLEALFSHPDVRFTPNRGCLGSVTDFAATTEDITSLCCKLGIVGSN